MADVGSKLRISNAILGAFFATDFDEIVNPFGVPPTLVRTLELEAADVCFLKAAWAPGGLHEGPGWPRGGSGGAVGGCKMLGFQLFFCNVFTFSTQLTFLFMLLLRGGAGVLPKLAL